MVGTTTPIVLGPAPTKELQFAAEWLRTALQLQSCSSASSGGYVDASNTTSSSSSSVHSNRATVQVQVVLGDTDNPEVAALMAARKLRFSDQLGEEGYILDAADDAVLVAAPKASGIFHGVQTLLQLVSKASGGSSCSVQPVRIEDYPNTLMRGVYMYGGEWENASASLSCVHATDELRW